MNTRRDLLKAAGAVSAIALVGPSLAQAGFSGNFDSVLDMSNGGTIVHAGGPAAGWEADDQTAWVIATIVQDNVVAFGIAATDPNKSAWSARLATNGNSRLHAGNAQANAVAVVQHDDGTLETYPWSQSVTLR